MFKIPEKVYIMIRTNCSRLPTPFGSLSIFYFCYILLFIISCHREAVSLIYVKDINCSRNKLSLQLEQDEIGYYNTKESTILYCVANFDHKPCLLTANTADSTSVKKYDFLNLGNFSFENNRIPLVKALDSVYFISGNNVILVNNVGRVIQSFYIKLNSDSHKDTFEVSASFAAPAILNKTSLVCCKNYLNIKGSDNDLLASFRKTSNISFSFSNDTLAYESEFGKFPIEYTKNFYYDLFPSICAGKNNIYVMSFGIIDSLYEFQSTKQISVKVAKSKHTSTVNEFPSGMITNYEYINRYNLTEFRYIKIIFDKYNNLYYRIIKKATENIQEEAPWSIMVLDNELNVLNEIDMNPKIFSYASIIPTEKGLLISRLKNDKYLFSYGLFKILKNKNF